MRFKRKRRWMLPIAAFFASCMMSSFVSFAEDKVIEVPVKNNYNDCEFVIQGKDENFSSYTFRIESPDGSVYYAQIEKEGEAHCAVASVPSGTWKVTINNDGVTTQESNGNDENVAESSAAETTAPSESENSETTAAANNSAIGEITVSLRPTSLAEAGVDDKKNNGIIIAKELTGLKIYFKDDSVVVEWSDSTVKNVDVRVIDTNTQKLLGSENVSTGEYECPLPLSTKQITVSVVPSTSVNVQGAGQQFTYDVNNHPNAVVTFPDIKYTNSATLEATAELGQRYTLQTYVNDSIVNTEKDKSAGKYTEKIPLSEGVNSIKLYVVDDNGNMRSTSKEVTLDTKPPSLLIEKNYDGVTTESSKVTFSGKAEDYSKLTLNEKTAIDAAYDGTFTVESELMIGDNKFLIRAEDEAGNVADYKAVITRIEKKPTLINGPADLVKFIAFFALIIYLIVNGIRKRKKKKAVKNIEDTSVTDDVSVPSDVPKEKRGFFKRREKKQEEESVEKKKHKKKERHKAKPKGDNEQQNIPSAFRTLLGIAFPVALFALVLRFVLCVTIVSSASMVPTLKVGDINIANRLAYIQREPKRGEIIILSNTSTGGFDYVKRIIGLPGDKISFKNGYVYINGKRCDETYLDSTIETNCTKTFEVPENSYLVLGDNRENSIDSRFWKEPYVKKDEIVGKVIADLRNPFS